MYQLVFTLLLCWLALPVLAQQQLAKARQSSYLTKVFRLTTTQAQRLYEHGLRAARPDFFTLAVDSFPSDKPAWPRLPLGYYLVAHTEGPELVYWLRAETSRTLQVIDNQTDLALAVRDSLGQFLADAQVAVGSRPLPYDPATRTYRRARPSRAGIVAVTAGGRTTFHPLAQTYQQPGHFNWLAGGWLRVGRRVLYGRPLGYVTGPVWRTVRDLKHASSTTTGLVGLLRSPFSEDVRDERQRRREQHRDERPTRTQQKWQSYLVVSQPRYRPTHDTLRLKARVLRRGSGRPSTHPLTLWLSNSGLARRKRLASLRPVRPGSYEFSLPLTDTLGLRVGTTASLSLEDEGGHALAEGEFKFEDYELNNSSFTMRMLEKEPRRGQPQAVFLRGTDASELNLLDARVRLTVVPSSGPRQVLGRRLFVPDTLWTHTQALDPTGETRVNLPADIFPNAELTYEVQATFLTSDNERHVETASLLYSLDPGRLHLTLDDDSVRLSYDSLGLPRPHRARLEIARLNPAPGDSLYFRSGPVRLPLALPVNPQATGYRVRDAAGRSAEVYLRGDNAGLILGSARTADSLRLAVANPHGLPFWYYVYRDNTLRYRGYGTGYQLAIRESNVATWHVSLHYPWGGTLQTAEYSVGPVQRALNIVAEQPAIAYPGQRLRLGFVVTDEHGRPVPDADLTAYAYSSKFAQSTLPTIPDTAPPVPGRVARQRFALAATFSHYTTQRQRLAWQQWHHQLGLDSLQFYHFLYPAEGAFYEYRPAPGGLTQVSVFVVDSGRVQAPIAVYVDGQPAYIHDVNENQPYVAVADSGHHTLSIRTANRLITLRDVYLLARHKLTLGLDPNYACAELRVEKRPAQLQPDELLALRRTLVAVRGQVPSTLRQGAVLRPLSGSYGRYYAGMTVAGPFAPDSLLLRPLRAEDGAANGGRRKFLFEPLYRYQFTPGVVKMDCLDPAQLGPLNGAGLRTPLPLGDVAYTEAALRPWEYAPATPSRPALKQRQRRASRPVPFQPRQGPPQLDYPDQTLAGQGRLQLLLPDSTARPLYVLLTRPDQPKFQRLQPAHEPLQGLAPGRYRVAVLLADSSCLLPPDLVLTPADGQTYFRLRRTERRLAPAFSHRLNQWLWRLTPVVARPVVAPEQRKIQVTQPSRPGLNTRLVRGRVVARDTEEGLPGVTVLVKNSTLGTSTDADGSFVLHVPMDTQTLLFSFVGYVTQEQALDYTGKLTVVLSESAQQLSEVVVTGYGAPTRREITGSVSSVVGYSLRGRAAGVSVSGAPANVLIRGMATGAAGEQPLYIVNGLPFSGKLTDISPDDIQEMKVLKGPEAAMYGARASGGVVLITLKSKAALAGQPAGSDLLPGTDPRLALRRHFSDYAWWRPTLVTDGQGRAHTNVVLPDDVTSWETFVIGSDNHRRVGTATGRVRAFKSLLATLSGPRFLVAGDRVQLLGKALNYQPDTARLTATFRVGGQVVRRQAHRVATALLDTLTVTAPAAADSLQVAFGLEQASGYADGEQRSLPVLPVGTRERVGTYAVLTAPDTTITLPLNPSLGAVQLRVESDALPTLLAEIHHLQEYAYLCNEQAASRLLGLLLEQRIATLQGTAFKGQKVVNFLIKKLQDGRHQPEGIWGTWPTSEVSPWATVHVVEALLAAEKLGYAAGLDRPALHAYLLHELDESLGEPTPGPDHRDRGHFGADDDQIRLLKLLHELGAPANYGTYLRRIEASAPRRPPLDRYLALTELRQQLGLSYQLDTLRRYRLRTELGGISYGDTMRESSYYRYLLASRVGTTLLAYKVLRQQGGHAAELARIRTYLLGQRGGGYWESTYETAQILTTIGPDLLVPGSGGKAAVVQLSGSPALPAGPVSQFPLALTLPAGTGALTLRKQGGLPVYATAYQTRWNPAPEAAAAPFIVRTTLAGQASGRVRLPAGQPAELEVTVDVKADVRYALLEVPIPAGCSYGPTATDNSLETHREYLKHQVGIFIDHLPVGRHTFQVALQPRYRGSYTLNPARLEMVYFPTKYGRTAGKRVEIK